MSTFCKLSYHRKCQRRGVGGQKSKNLVNVVCERPLTRNVNDPLRENHVSGSVLMFQLMRDSQTNTYIS